MLVSFPARQTESTAFQTFHEEIRLHTSGCFQFIDLTEEVRALVVASGIKDGLLNVQTRHTTATITINEDEPLLLEDMKLTLERLAPRDMQYRHDDFAVRTANLTPDEKPNGHAHCKALFLRGSETVNVAEGEMQLGRWQRIFFIELDCARERTVSVMVMGCRSYSTGSIRRTVPSGLLPPDANSVAT
jgi:secondary thiamine-phosphate synthase enzyme